MGKINQKEKETHQLHPRNVHHCTRPKKPEVRREQSSEHGLEQRQPPSSVEGQLRPSGFARSPSATEELGGKRGIRKSFVSYFIFSPFIVGRERER